MQAIFNSFLLVAATEMGDKTQLLAFVLASRFRNPWPVLAGIFTATVLNHFLAAYFGAWVSQTVPPEYLRWLLALTFIGFAIWVLIPDKEEEQQSSGRFGAYLTTVFAFFMAEMVDKTQLATVALAVKYDSIVLVTVGTTLGMMFADGLAVVFGERLTRRISLRWVRRFSALLFLLFGVAIVANASELSSGNTKIANFAKAKKVATAMHLEHQVTVYCPCLYSGKKVNLQSCGYKVQHDARRAARLEWEHIVPAEAFGQSFREWREGGSQCVKRSGRKYKGRRCAETNAEFARMEGDLYNLWPVIGELNGLRSNFSMAEISGPARTFGGCKAKIQRRKFEPMDEYKGLVARTYFYMETAYPGHGIVSEKNRKLFEVWDKKFPVGAWECRHAELVAKAQGNVNSILSEKCKDIPALKRKLSGG
jgi:putative Ca2+/H+ antiporter (TMEM165/GDT1 family)/endonuclease I